MHRRRIRYTTMLIAFILSFSTMGFKAKANEVKKEEGTAGLASLLNEYYGEKTTTNHLTSLLSTPIEIPNHIVIAKCNDSINIREHAGTSYNILGKLPKDAAAYVLEEKDGWAKITSGDVTGYVSTEYLYMGEAGAQKARELAVLKATVTASNVNVRSTASTLSDDNIITEINRGEDLIVIEEEAIEVVTKADPKATIWVKVVIDNNEGYISKEFVELSYKWKLACKIETVTASSLRTTIISEARKHLGLPYVWGGDSLSKGADCSGFIWAIYKKCGLSVKELGLPRTSSEMARGGKKVTTATLQPGDLIFYGNRNGQVDHVAMYIGNGKVIHESGRREGCKISNMNYRKIITMRNYLD